MKYRIEADETSRWFYLINDGSYLDLSTYVNYKFQKNCSSNIYDLQGFYLNPLIRYEILEVTNKIYTI